MSHTSTEATVTFRGDLSGTNVAEMTVSDITDTKGATPAVSTDTAGVAADMVNPLTETHYDALGRVDYTIDARGGKTTYSWEYLTPGQKLTITLPDPDGIGIGDDPPVLYQEFDGAGNLVSETDANGNETVREYDILGRLSKLIQADAGDGSPVTEYQYDLTGNLRFVTDPLGNTTEYQYDHRHRQVKVISADPDLDGPLSALVTVSVYDDAGQLTSVTAPGGRETVYDYDDLGRTISVAAPDPDGVGGVSAPVTSYTYDAAGQLIAMTDPMDNDTLYGYDSLGNQVLVVYPDPDGVGTQDPPLSYREYDAVGQLLTESQGLVRNEIQRLYFGSKASSATPTAGTFILEFDGQTTTAFGATASASEIEGWFGSLSNVGYGNIMVTDAPGGFLFVFRGDLASQDVPAISVNSNSLESTNGISVSANVTQAASAGGNEVQALSFGGATTGTFDINSVTVSSLDAYGVQTALDTIWGSGNTSVYFNGSSYEVTFTSSYAAQNVSEMSITSNSTDGSPSVSTNTQGYAGQPEVVQFSISGSPDRGDWSIGLNSSYTDVDYNISAGSLETAINGGLGGSVTVSGTWTVTTIGNASAGSWSAQSSSGTPLARGVGIELEEVHPGGMAWWNTTSYEYDALGRLISVATTTNAMTQLAGSESPV